MPNIARRIIRPPPTTKPGQVTSSTNSEHRTGPSTTVLTIGTLYNCVRFLPIGSWMLLVASCEHARGETTRSALFISGWYGTIRPWFVESPVIFRWYPDIFALFNFTYTHFQVFRVILPNRLRLVYGGG